jgi:pimeloyl-ACP methyl ester carboxylesterase
VEEALVDIGGLELAVRRWRGPGRPVVLVHGLASNARLWDGVGRRLADAGLDAVAVDQRGHGRSAKPDDGYGMATVVADLLGLMDALGLDRPVLAGQSWGGNVVLEAAATAPERVAALCLVDGGWIHLADTFPVWEDCERALRPPPLAGLSASRVEAAIRSMHPDWPEEGIQGALANMEVLPDGTIRPWLTLDRHLRILRALWEHQPRRRYAEVCCPVLLAPAGAPEEAPSRGFDPRPAIAEALAMVGAASVRWFPGADHDLHAQRPGELADELVRLAGEVG